MTNSNKRLPDNWGLAKLEDPEVCTVIMGQSPPGATYNTTGEGLPFYQGKADFGEVYPTPRVWCTQPKKLAEPGDILLSVRAPVGPTNLANESCCIGRGLAAIRGNRKALTGYLFYWFKHIESWLTSKGEGSTFTAIGKERLVNLRVPIPALPVQDLIFQILQKADEIRRKRREALEMAEATLPAFFISMFGDPSENHGKFERLPLGKLADLRSGVTKGRNLHGKETIEVPYLRVANVQDGFLDLSEVKTIEVLPEDVDKYHLEDGDILMTEGGDPDKLGRGSVWRNQIEGCIHQNHIFRVRTNRDKLAPEYLAALLRTQYAKHYFLSCAKRSSNLASVNSTQVKAFPVPLPSIKLQEKFVSAVEQWVQASDRLSGALKGSMNLFESIMTNAFTGALTAEWEAANSEWITKQVELQERLPQLLLLALVWEKASHSGRKAAQAAILVTALMKYAFLLQMEGNGQRRLYHFVPYHYGPFAKELYADLKRLQTDGLLTIENDTEEDKIRITLADPAKVAKALADLPEDLKEDVNAILDTYGDLDHNALLQAVYEKYPFYAQRSRLRKTRKKIEI